MSVFSKIELVKAFNQIPMNPSDIEKTAVATPFGLYEWLYMPFGLRNAGSTLQRYLSNVFMDLDCVFIYTDDILVFCKDEKQHKEISSRSYRSCMTLTRVAIHKSHFFLQKIDFLGYSISKEGMKPSSCKLNTIRDFPETNNTKSLRSFLGLISYYRHLIPDFTDIVLPLTEFVRLNQKNTSVTFTSAEKKGLRRYWPPLLLLFILCLVSHSFTW